VHRRVRHRHTRHLWAQANAGGSRDVGIDQLGTDRLDERVVVRGEVDGDGIDLVDPGRDAGVVGWHDLGAVTEVHLVSVVRRWVV
jgi:hypothetical protein